MSNDVTGGNTKLEEALGLSPQPTPNTAVVVARPPAPIVSDSKIEDDAEFARQEVYDLVSKGGEAIEQIMEVARESQHPRAYEVLAQMLKTQSDNVNQLLKIQKDKKQLLQPDDAATGNPAPINVANAVFVGTSSELIRMIRKENKEPYVIDIDAEYTDE